MSFKDHEGLTECTKFSDFFNWISLNLNKILCPECGSDMKGLIFTGLNMNLVGHAEFICKNEKCLQSRQSIKIESIWRE